MTQFICPAVYIYMLPINYTDKQTYCQKAYTVSILHIITSEELGAGNIPEFKELKRYSKAKKAFE